MPDIIAWYSTAGAFGAALAVAAAAGLLLIAERLHGIVLRTRIQARPFMEQVITLARGGKIDEALATCVQHKSAVPDLGLVILRSRGGNEDDLRQIARAAILTVAQRLQRRLHWFSALARIAILLGVLGAIANAYGVVTDASVGNARASGLGATAATADAALLAMVLAVALPPVGLGVLIAIPLIAAEAYFVAESTKILGWLEEFAMRLINVLLERPDVRLGHRD